eukprot:3602323-Pleurochrysis_carterae.AAC.1
MYAALKDACKVPHASDLLVSSSVASFLRSLHLCPAAFACNSLDRRSVAEEFADRCTWIASDSTGAALVERRRLRFALSHYPVLASILLPFRKESMALIMLERLLAALLPRSSPSPRLSIVIADLEQQLLDRQAIVEPLLAEGASPQEVVNALLAET